MRGACHTILVALAKVVGDGHVSTQRDAYKQVDHQADEVGVCADGGQRVRAGKAAHHRHISRIEQLLQKAACRNWQREGDDLGHERSVQHVYVM